MLQFSAVIPRQRKLWRRETLAEDQHTSLLWGALQVKIELGCPSPCQLTLLLCIWCLRVEITVTSCCCCCCCCYCCVAVSVTQASSCPHPHHRQKSISPHLDSSALSCLSFSGSCRSEKVLFFPHLLEGRELVPYIKSLTMPCWMNIRLRVCKQRKQNLQKAASQQAQIYRLHQRNLSLKELQHFCSYTLRFLLLWTVS